jgi:hypothetical protein
MGRGTYHLLRAQGNTSKFPRDAPGTGGSGGAPKCGTANSVDPSHPGLLGAPRLGSPRAQAKGALVRQERAHALGPDLRQGADLLCLTAQLSGPALVLISWVPVTLGSAAAGRCAGVTGLLFRAPRSGPGNVPSAGAWGGIVHARAPSHSQYPVLLRSTPQPDTPDFLSSSPSPTQARLLALSQQSLGPQPRSPSSLQLGLPTPSLLPPIRPLHAGPHHSPVRPSCLGSHLHPPRPPTPHSSPKHPLTRPRAPAGGGGTLPAPHSQALPSPMLHPVPPSRPGRQCCFSPLVLASSPPPQFPIPGTLPASCGPPDPIAFV